jgi:formamidopyrimidine-DNA glycosylase
MPELPEVETVARGLSGPLSGRTIGAARIYRRSLYRTGSLPLKRLDGVKIVAVERFGKAILFRTVLPAPVLVVHLGMTGNLLIERGPRLPRKHRHAVLVMDNGIRVEYIDSRRFGYLWAGPLEGLGARFNIGPDPFELTGAGLKQRLDGRRAPVKSLLLNQSLVAGLGNIYTDEILFEARVHPLTAGSVAAADAAGILRHARAVLRRAVDGGGTTIRDYRKSDGTSGEFQRELAVYARTGEPCRRCGTAVERIVISARSTHFCPRCQKYLR